MRKLPYLTDNLLMITALLLLLPSAAHNFFSSCSMYYLAYFWRVFHRSDSIAHAGGGEGWGQLSQGLRMVPTDTFTTAKKNYFSQFCLLGDKFSFLVVFFSKTISEKPQTILAIRKAILIVRNRFHGEYLRSIQKSSLGWKTTRNRSISAASREKREIKLIHCPPVH